MNTIEWCRGFEDMKDEISSTFNPGLHIVVTIVEHVCECVQKKVLKLLRYRLEIFPVKDHYLESLQLYGEQFIPGQLKKFVRQHILPILNNYMETRL